MKSINFDFNLTDLDGQPIQPEVKAGKVLANAMAAITGHANPVKLWDWSLTMHSGKPVTLDDASVAELSALIIDSKMITVLTQAQLIKAIQSAAST